METVWSLVTILICLAGVVAVYYFWYQQLQGKEVVLIGGFGKWYFGWQAGGDGVYLATKWLVFLYLPIIPLQRQLFKIHDEPHSPSAIEIVGAIFGHAEDRFRLVVFGSEPPKISEVFLTYFRTYLLLPLAIAWPIPIFAVVVPLLPKNTPFVQSDTFVYIMVVIGLAYFVYAFALIVHAVRRTYCFRYYDTTKAN